MSDKITMTVVMQVTEAQAIALREMFDYWNYLSNIGSSRKVSFYVDGDGNFHPYVQMLFNPPLASYFHQRRDIAEKAIAEDEDGDRLYDYDDVAWALYEARQALREVRSVEQEETSSE